MNQIVRIPPQQGRHVAQGNVIAFPEPHTAPVMLGFSPAMEARLIQSGLARRNSPRVGSLDEALKRVARAAGRMRTLLIPLADPFVDALEVTRRVAATAPRCRVRAVAVWVPRPRMVEEEVRRLCPEADFKVIRLGELAGDGRRGYSCPASTASSA